MSHEPPIPEAAQSPYPKEEAPHPDPAVPPVADAGDARTVSDKGRELIEGLRDGSIDSRTIIGVGAAITLGVGATVAALLFTRRRPTPPPAPKRRRAASKAAPKRGGAAKSRAAKAAKAGRV